MIDYREKDQGMGAGQQGGQHAPTRNPKDDRSAGGRQGDKNSGGQKQGNLDQQSGIKRGDGRSYKETGPREETTKR